MMSASEYVAMKYRRLVVLVVLGLCAVAGPAAQTEDLALMVRGFFPPSLIDADDPDNTRGQQCYGVLESDAQGPTTVLAAYTYVTLAKVRVLRKASSGWSVVAEPSGDEYGAGPQCEISLIDIDGDGRKEAHVQFVGWRGGTEDWIYGWSNGQLVGLTPTTAEPALAGRKTTNLVNASFLDLDGDGRLEIYSFNPPPRDPTDPFDGSQIYRISSTGEYVLDHPVVGLWEFTRTGGGPQTITELVRAPGGASGPMMLRVINGAGTTGTGQRVENAVESGRVWFNGEELVRPNDFGNQVALIDRTVNLNTENELRVRLAGAPGGRITIVIQAP